MPSKGIIMKFLTFISVLFLSMTAIANPFARFEGQYVVTSSLVSVCTFSKSQCGFNSWNLDMMKSVSIYKKQYLDPNGSGSTFHGLITVGGNSVLFQSAEAGMNGGGHHQELFSSPDGMEATVIEYFDKTNLRSGITNRIAQMPDGTFQFTFERVISDTLFEKYVYKVAPVHPKLR